jgi:streptogramin lyase
VERTVVTNQPYGGAMDGLGNFWIVGSFCTVGVCNLARVNTGTLAVDMFRVPCGYGISVDAFDRVWTSGKTMLASCVNRLDPSTGENVTYNSRGLDDFYRGIAVDNRGSVWVANTKGTIVQVREADVGFVGEYPGGPEAVVGVAIDYHDYVWAVSQGGNAALRMDPETHAVESFPVGTGPYTYSDMTGFQLRTVIMY